MDNPKKRIRLKCRYDSEIRMYEDQDGDLITLASQHDFEDLLLAESDVVNVIVSENMLPSLNKREPKVTSSLWTQGAGTNHGQNWAKEQQQQNTQRSQSPFLHSPSPLSTIRQTTSNNRMERFPLIDSSVTPPATVRPTRWKRGEILGQGAFGVVYLGLNVESGELMAVKQINNDELKTKELSSLENEINVLRGLKHPNIVRYIGTEKNPYTLSIFLEYVPGGSLKSLIDKFGKLEETVVRSYTRQLLLGLEYLHRNGIAHRDIKGANCLVGNDGAVKLADFGASNSWRSPVESKAEAAAAAAQDSNNDVKGTPSWMPPEVIRGEKPLNWKKADVWSLGCTTIEMTTGKPPWSQFDNPVTVLYHIACSDTVPEYPEDPSIELLTFLNSCLKRDHNERTDLTSLLLHPFVASLQVQGGPGGGTWSTGNWGQRPTTVSTTPAGEWQDTISQWKDFNLSAATVTDSSVLVKSSLSSSPRSSYSGGVDVAARLQDRNGLSSAGDTSPRKSLSSPRGNLADLDLESTLSRNHVIDTTAIVRAHSSRGITTTGRKSSNKSSNTSETLASLTAKDFKKDEDRQQISDLLSVGSLGGASLENSLDDLEDSTSTLGSGRVILESLDEMRSLVCQDVVATSGPVSSRGFNLDDDSSLSLNSDRTQSKKNSIAQQTSLKDNVHMSPGREFNPKNSGNLISITSSPKASRKSKSAAVGSSIGKDTLSKNRVKQQSNLISPVKQLYSSGAKNADGKSVNDGDKMGERVMKLKFSSGEESLSSPSVRQSTSTRQPPPSIHISSLTGEDNSNAPSMVMASPIQISNNLSRAKSKPFEYSTRPGEKNRSTGNSSSVSSGGGGGGGSGSSKVGRKEKSASTSTVFHQETFMAKAEENSIAVAFSSSQKSNTEEIKDEAEVHDEEDNFSAGEDNESVADELSDDSDVHMEAGRIVNDDDDDDMMEFSACMGSSLSGFDFSLPCYGESGSSSKRGNKTNWTTDSYSKDKQKAGSQSSAKQCLGQSKSSSSVLTSEVTSDPNIGMYELVGRSLRQGTNAPSGSVQGTRIKTSLPSSKQQQQQRATKTPSSATAKQQGSASRGGGESAFRNLKIAGDSIDLRIGTGVAPGTATSSTPLASILTKRGGEDRFFDASLDGFDMPAGRRDDQDEDSETSLTLPLHSVAEELDEHTSAITKLRMVLARNVLISASLDGTMRIWGTEGSNSSRAILDIPSFDAKAKKAIPATPKPVKLCGLWVDSNCDYIWGGCSDGIIRVWNGGEGKPHRMMKGHEELVTNLEGAPIEHMSSHCCASASQDRTARVWDSRAKKAQSALFRGHADTIYSLKWLDGGRSIATASKDKTIKIWDVRTGRLQTTLDKHYGAVSLLKNLPDDFKPPTRKDVGGGGGGVSGDQPACSHSHFLSVARDGIMSLWSSDGTCLASQGAHRTAVTCMSDVQACSHGPRVVTSGLDSIVRVWDLRRMKISSEFSQPNVVKVAWFNQSVVTGSSSGEMYVWDYRDSEVGADNADAEAGVNGGGDEGSRGWSARALTHHSHQCSDLVTSKYCVASASKSGMILRYSAL